MNKSYLQQRWIQQDQNQLGFVPGCTLPLPRISSSYEIKEKEFIYYIKKLDLFPTIEMLNNVRRKLLYCVHTSPK